MLKLVAGVSGSGKTTHLYAEITQRARAGQKSILLVPEQFTSSTEGRIYRELGDGLSGLVESFSFTSLAEKLLETLGGAAVKTLSDAGRAVLVRRALEGLADNVRYYYRHRRSAAFCRMAAETIDELKSAGLSGEQLGRLAQQCGPEKTKLAELSLIFSGYEALLAQTGMDPSDRLTLAAERLDAALARGELPDFLQGRAVFIDEFDTFNAPKKRLMAAMLAAMPAVTVALCDDGLPAEPGVTGLFSGAKRVAMDLKALARRGGVAVAEDVRLREDVRHRGAPGLAAAAELLACEDCAWDGAAGEAAPGLTLYAAQSREEEARAAACAIQKLVRGGARFEQIAVVCRDADQYRAAVRYEFRMADIPLYCDEATTPEFSAPATAIKALLGLARGMDYTDNVLALAKSGLCTLSEAQVCALENYVYTWSPNRKAWHAVFDRSPQGFGETARLTEEDLANTALAEEARAFLVLPVDALCAAAKGKTAEQLSREIYFCLKALGAEERQAAQVEALRESDGIPAAEEAAREWNVVMGLLNEMAQLLGNEAVEPAEYADLFGLLLRASDLGHIPQTLDSVLFTSAGKMRLNAPDYVFVLGLAEGEFPHAPGENGLLTHADRDALMAQKIELPDCFENRVVREQVCFYKALTAPAKGLWMSWPEGLGLVMSAALEPIAERLCPAAPVFSAADMAPTPAAALDRLGSVWGLDGEEAAALYAALEAEKQGTPSGLAAPEDGLAMLRRMAENAPKRVKDLKAMEAVLGGELRISPSQMEKYYSCRYGYFLQYVLGLRPRQRAELSPNQSGTLMHWVLQMALDPDEKTNPYRAWQSGPFDTLSDGELGGLAARLVDEYARLFLPADSTRFSYLLSRLKKSMAGLLCYLRDEQRQSLFEPVACEQKIGAGTGCLPPQTYRLSGGRVARVVGTIDRVDEWTEADGTRWVRVVDYKTGTKKFDLREVYCGLDCQMLLYLFSLTHDASGRFTGAKPAGVLYLLADPAPEIRPRAAAADKIDYHLDGLIRDENKVFEAMDADESGRYLPFGFVDGRPSPYQKKKRADADKLTRIETHLNRLVADMAEGLYQGEIAAEPLRAGRLPCTYCDFGFVCCHEDGVGERVLDAPAAPFEPESEKTDADGAEKTDKKETDTAAAQKAPAAPCTEKNGREE